MTVKKQQEDTRLTLQDVVGPLKHVSDILSGAQGVYWYGKIREVIPERKRQFLKPIDENQKELYLDEGGVVLIMLLKELLSSKGVNFLKVLKLVLRKENSPEAMMEILENQNEFSFSVLKEMYRKEGVVPESIEIFEKKE